MVVNMCIDNILKIDTLTVVQNTILAAILENNLGKKVCIFKNFETIFKANNLESILLQTNSAWKELEVA